jgi:hypothetical protein
MKLLKTTLAIKCRIFSFSYASAIMGFLILTSCATTKPIPVAYKCPQLVLPPDPITPLDKLTDKSKPDEVMKAWVSTAVAYRDWNHIVRQQVNVSL